MSAATKLLATLLITLMLTPTWAAANPYDIPHHDSMTEQCQRIGHKLGSVSVTDCLAARLTPLDGYSASGQLLLMREFPPLSHRQPQARVLLIGGIHGDEFSAVSIVFKWIKILSQHHSGVFHWHIIPLMNPDGLLQRVSQRMNGDGVDLNRNLPTKDWQQKSRQYWIHRTHRDPRRYPGEEPGSEPETQALIKEIEQFQPDVIISVHAPYGILDFDGPPKAPKHIGYLYTRLLGTYPGSLGNYAGVERQIPVITMELPTAGIMPTPWQIRRMWIDIVAWIRHHIPRQQTTNFRQRHPISSTISAPPS
ncbi:MAG: M14 family murein peptide amidase A [Mariprofundales bacterium]|nr:M14 family murein peptide amidase A [Mariprofundales bacterium]